MKNLKNFEKSHLICKNLINIHEVKKKYILNFMTFEKISKNKKIQEFFKNLI